MQAGFAAEVYYRCVEDCFEPIMLTDIKGTLKYVNPAWCLTYGYTKDEAIGNSPKLLRSDYQTDEFYRQMWATILNPKIGFWRGEIVNRAKDGHFVPVLLTITPYRGPAGDILGYMGIAVDLSEQKSMEQQIIRQDRLASVGMLASGMAHEIGNPMGVIRGRAELLRQQVKDNEAAEKNLEVIIGQIDRITGLIQSLLKVSRVPDVISLSPIALQPVVDEVGVLLRESCRKANVDILIHDLKCNVLAEPSNLQQIILNLMINSLHAIEDQNSRGPSPLLNEKRPRHFLDLSADCDADFCYIKIKDSGCGRPSENLQKIFRIFFTTKAAGKGTGMGLAIAAKQMEEMNGSVNCFSDGAGFGATFVLTLRRAK